MLQLKAYKIIYGSINSMFVTNLMDSEVVDLYRQLCLQGETQQSIGQAEFPQRQLHPAADSRGLHLLYTLVPIVAHVPDHFL